jgi:formylmethanofuran dehydrogenase subunit B
MVEEKDVISIPDVTCPFCGTLCDDIEVLVKGNEIQNARHACRIGSTKFLSVGGAERGHRPLKPLIRRGGTFQEATMEEALDEAAQILAESRRALLYGWSATYCEAHAVGIQLAEEIGAVIDSCTTVCHGPSELAFQDVGYPTVTLGDVKNRADLLIYWGSNPMHAHPRHLSRYSIFPRGYFRERGFQDREMIVVDVRKTDTAKIAQQFIQVRPGEDYELFAALRVVVNGGELEAEEVSGVPKEKILELAEKLKTCQFGVIFFGMGLTQSPGKIRNVDNAICLVKDLNRFTKFSIVMMRGHYNVTGFSEVLAWSSGYPIAVDYSRGYPRYNPGETAANDILLRGEADAMLSIAADPGAHFPANSVRHMARIPFIAIDPHWTPTTELADVYIPSAVAGIEVAGTTYRMDGIPIKLRKVIDPPPGILTDTEILTRLLEKVREKKGLPPKPLTIPH